MITLKVKFHHAILCTPGEGSWTFAATADQWAANFGSVEANATGGAFSVGLITLQSGFALLYPSGTAYILAPDNVTPNHYASLVTNWSHDCIVVDSIEQVAGQPDPSAEQAAVDHDNPPGGAATKTFEETLDALAKFIAKALTDVVILAGVLVVIWIIIDTKAWQYVKVPKFVKKVLP